MAMLPPAPAGCLSLICAPTSPMLTSAPMFITRYWKVCVYFSGFLKNHKLLDVRGPKWVASFGDLTCLCDCGQLASAQQMSGE